ncbi:hypothetical protein TraAM80_02273 [Trypanosoma rangeli]|uniref:Uncharacterized protein n=1 Tax=Trypanosoma rangeli TaxID=5698 RepID=A0A422NV20_TRYRA|nr:uncharacterized protein TraAM80_02273 [Trypanosoma rangeli]RNF09323.1 hypothetical protein TraAM80_02273 [Trypanosoma rangeli]|eukprot:RNF09323.1 hypothetical protein TraAM80_02273 [Trypanosoma rangeli]
MTLQEDEAVDALAAPWRHGDWWGNKYEALMGHNQGFFPAAAEKIHGSDGANQGVEWEAEEGGSVRASSSPWDLHEQNQQDAFTEKFLRRREALALQDLLGEVRGLMRSCRLPAIDADVIEKHIITPVERAVRQEAETPSRMSPTEADTQETSAPPPSDSCGGLDKNGGSFEGIVPTPSQGMTSASTATPVCKHVEAAVRTVAGGTHSRHPACHALLLQGAVGRHREKQCLLKTRMEGAHASNHVKGLLARRAASPLEQRGRRLSVEPGVNVNRSGARGVRATGKHEAVITDMMQLRWLLRRHVARTLDVLDIVDQRETIISKLREFLAMAESDLCVKRASRHSDDDAAQRRPFRSGSLRPWVRQRQPWQRLQSLTPFFDLPNQQACMFPRRPASSAVHGVVGIPQVGAAVIRRRYYRHGVLYFMWLLQQVSVELLRAVRRWRELLSGSFPFVVKGNNYLLQISLEMAELAQEPVLQKLFSSHARPRKGAPTKTGHADVDPEDAAFPESLQYCPLLSDMPCVMEYTKPPTLPTNGGVALVELGERNPGNEKDWFPRLPQAHHTTEVRQKRRLHGKGVSADAAYICRVRAAETFLNREVTVQMQLLRRNFVLCAEGRYPLLLCGVGELCGSRDTTVRLHSRQRQREWFCQLHDMLSCLEAGSSALCKE